MFLTVKSYLQTSRDSGAPQRASANEDSSPIPVIQREENKVSHLSEIGVKGSRPKEYIMHLPCVLFGYAIQAAEPISPRRLVYQHDPLEGRDEKVLCRDGIPVSAHRAVDIRDDGGRIYGIQSFILRGLNER